MRRQGQRHAGPRLLEAHTARSQRIQRRRAPRGIAIATHTIGTQRVDRDQQHIRLLARRLSPAARGRHSSEQYDQPATHRTTTA